jgi:hypothetical protein
MRSFVEPDLDRALGVFDGLYEPDYLDRLRSEERALSTTRALPQRLAENQTSK